MDSGLSSCLLLSRSLPGCFNLGLRRLERLSLGGLLCSLSLSGGLGLSLCRRRLCCLLCCQGLLLLEVVSRGRCCLLILSYFLGPVGFLFLSPVFLVFLAFVERNGCILVVILFQ